MCDRIVGKLELYQAGSAFHLEPNSHQCNASNGVMQVGKQTHLGWLNSFQERNTLHQVESHMLKSSQGHMLDGCMIYLLSQASIAILLLSHRVWKATSSLAWLQHLSLFWPVVKRGCV